SRHGAHIARTAGAAADSGIRSKPASLRPCARLAHFLPLLHADQHFAGLAAVVMAHDAVLGHVVDEAGRLAVADPERSLQQRYAPAALAHDHFHGLLVERIARLDAAAR